jgi:hypothetical protein
MRPEEPPSAPTIAAVTRAHDDLAFPDGITRPNTIAYDAVSARFVVGIADSDALTVLSQTSTNAALFTSRGWSGGAATTAVAIDRAAGDLWVAVAGESGGALHRLQLISGRRLGLIEAPEDARIELVALTVASDGVYALDRTGRRIYRRAPGATALTLQLPLGEDIQPLGLARSRSALYVSHEQGLLRAEMSSRRARPVTAPKGSSLAGLRSLAWHDGVLYAIQPGGEQWTVIRLRLNAAGTAVTRIERIGQAVSPAATLAGGVYYYVTTPDTGAGFAVRAIDAKP